MVAAGDFLERQEAVALAAEIDEGGFEARFDAGDAPLVDVPLLLFEGMVLDVEVVELLPIDHGNAHLFGLRRVHKHAFHVAYPFADADTRISSDQA